jgi:hypothetical protein
MMPNNESQLASTVLMIRPVRFESNPQTAASNRFQSQSGQSPKNQQSAAANEFEGLVNVLRTAGIEVIVVDDTAEPHTPDAVFPNNWVSFHADGKVVLYPMEASNRRAERRPDVIDMLAAEYGFQVSAVIDLSHHEANGHFLEGTGSMVLDRVNRVAYACLSTRTQLDALGDFAQQLDYDVVAFDAADRDGTPIYHTNVLMSVGERVAVICDEAIPRPEQRQAVLQRLGDSGHEIVSINFDQLESFAGNMLELRSADGRRVLAMSEQAKASLDAGQLEKLESDARIVSAPIDTIENAAGGSVRCMLAEIHLPRRDDS